jgi:hypothetical protein
VNVDHLCINRTEFTARCFLLDDPHGREAAVVCAKIAYEVGDDGLVGLAPRRAEVRPFDVPWWKTPTSSVRFPSDWIDDKPGTDVLLVGTAHPPPGRIVTSIEVTLRIWADRERLAKTVRVFGPRVWQRGVGRVAPGPAASLVPTPLTWELAQGAPQNPVGMGFAQDHEGLVGRPAHVLEPLGAAVTAGFGPIGADWPPRAARAGTCDEAWKRTRAPLRPVDFDPRHNNAAPDDQWLEQPLRGGEWVEISGVTPRGALRFQLPVYRPSFTAVLPSGAVESATHLDTLLVDADERRVEVSWRTRHPLPKRRADLGAIVLTTRDQLPAGLFVESGDPWRARDT